MAALLPRLLEPLTLPPAINWPHEPERLVWIYGLSDPRDGQLAVIGRSVTPENVDVWHGLRRHGVPDKLSARQAWLVGLVLEWRFPVTHLLAVAPEEWAEDYKRVYVDEAYAMGALLTTPRAAWSRGWSTQWAVEQRLRREARWVVARAYPALGPQGGDAAEPWYDDQTVRRLSRPPLTPAQWWDLKGASDADVALEAAAAVPDPRR